MTEQKLTNREFLVVNYVTSAIGNVLSHKELIEKIGVAAVIREFPRPAWQIIQEVLSDVGIAPGWEETEWEDDPDPDPRQITFLVAMVEAALSEQYAIVTHERLFNAVTVEALVKNFRAPIWESLTEALADEGDDDEDDDDEEPEVEEEENGSKGSRTPTLPGTLGQGNGD